MEDGVAAASVLPSHRIAIVLGEQREIQQTLRVIVSRAEQLAAGHVLERGRNAASHLHGFRIDRLRVAETRQRGAIRTQQKDRFDQIARSLFDRECGEFFVVD